ncbi:MAG: hypothetical protein ACXW2R_09655, partial [Candidatus Aminicenantales bacterium]
MTIKNLVGVTVLAAAVSALALAGLASDKISDDAKVYQTELEAMKGQEPRPILNKLAAWKFEAMAAW